MSNKLSLNFNRYKPKQNYTYEVVFYRPNGSDYDKLLSRLTTAVSSVTIAKVPIQTLQDEAMGFGLYWNVVPIHDIDGKEMSVTFEETDDMLVTSTFGAAMSYSNSYKDVWSNADFIIVVKYFNEYKFDTATGRAAEKVERYRAIVRDVTHPSFNRSGNVDKVDVVVNFKVVLDDQLGESGESVFNGDVNNYKDNIQPRLDYLNDCFRNKNFNIEEYNKKRDAEIAKQKAEEAERQRQAAAQSDNGSNSGSGRSSHPVRYKGNELDKILNEKRVTDSKGNVVTALSSVKDGFVYVDGRKYGIVNYGGGISLNSRLSGKDRFYSKKAETVEEAFNNITSKGKIPYNMGGKADGDISDGIDCMGFVGIVLDNIGAKVVDAKGNEVKVVVDDKEVKVDTLKFFSMYSTYSIKDQFKFKIPEGVDAKVWLKADENKKTGHIVIESGGYIYESASGKDGGVRKIEKKEYNLDGYIEYNHKT